MRWLLFGWGLGARLLSQKEITVLSAYRMICRQQHFAPLRRLKQVIKMHIVSDKNSCYWLLVCAFVCLLLCLFLARLFLSCVTTLSYVEWHQRQHGQGICPACWPDIVSVVWQQPLIITYTHVTLFTCLCFGLRVLMTLHVLFSALTRATLYRMQHSNLFFISRSQQGI